MLLAVFKYVSLPVLRLPQTVFAARVRRLRGRRLVDALGLLAALPSEACEQRALSVSVLLPVLLPLPLS